MATYYRWRCDSRNEFFDPCELLGPKCSMGRGYGVKDDSVPFSAWVVACLLLDRWRGCSVRLVGDGSVDYDCDGYDEISQHVLRNDLHLAPIDALRFLRREAENEPLVGQVESSVERVEHEDHVSFLERWAEEDWPRLCTEPGCDHYGIRHGGDHERKYLLRECAFGLDAVQAEPNRIVRLALKLDRDFQLETIVFAEPTWGKFVLRRITVLSEDFLEEKQILSSDTLLVNGPLRVNHPLQKGMTIEIIAKNVSKSTESFAACLCGTAKEEKRPEGK